MGALADIWKSERGLVALVLIAAVTVIGALGHFTPDQWLSYTKDIFYVYVGSKTVTGAVALVKGTTEPPPKTTPPIPTPIPTP